MSDPDRPGRRIRFTLGVRDETDDPSILNVVCRAIEDGLRPPPVVVSTFPASLAPALPSASEARFSLHENLETEAREAVEEALERVIEVFRAKGQEPTFDPAKWTEQLSRLWAVIACGKASGVVLKVEPPDPPPSDDV